MNGGKQTGGVLKSNPDSGTPRTYWVTYVSFARNPGKSGKAGKIETKSLDVNGIINILKDPGSEIFVIFPLKPGQIAGLDQDLAWALSYVKSLTQGGMKFIRDAYTILRDNLAGGIKDQLVHKDDLVRILQEDFSIISVRIFPDPSLLSTL